MAQTPRRNSKIQMNETLEKQYSKPTKCHSDITGLSRRKEAVCKRNIIKHEKSQCKNNLQKICDMRNDNKYSSYHEFLMTNTEKDVSAVNQMREYIKSQGNPFDLTQLMPRNFATCKQLQSWS